MKILLSKIFQKIKKGGFEFRPCEDLYFMCLECKKEDTPTAVKYLKLLSEYCEEVLKSG